MSFNGQCQCGNIKFTLENEPLFAQYCHCNKCRAVSSSSDRSSDKSGFSYTIACSTSDIRFTEGKSLLIPAKVNNAILFKCGSCNSQIYGISADERHQDGAGINGNNFEGNQDLPDSFKPVRHVYFADRAVSIFDNDELPKFVDMPEELGGTGKIYKPSLKDKLKNSI
jgi:hypothetical protein